MYCNTFFLIRWGGEVDPYHPLATPLRVQRMSIRFLDRPVVRQRIIILLELFFLCSNFSFYRLTHASIKWSPQRQFRFRFQRRVVNIPNGYKLQFIVLQTSIELNVLLYCLLQPRTLGHFCTYASSIIFGVHCIYYVL